jgi:RND superfamily putative drug exporter
VHPVTVWRDRLSIALEALEAGGESAAAMPRTGPVETTNVQLPTGDRLQIPTAAEALRMKAFLVLCRNTRADFSDLAGLADAMGIDNAASVLAGIDRYYNAGRPERLWLATQLVRRLAEPIPLDDADDRSDRSQTLGAWDDVRRRCLSLSVAILEEAS